MEKFKQFQPSIIVILVCLSIFQFIQIYKLTTEINDLQYQTSDIEEKIGKLSGKDFENEIDKLKSRVTDMEYDINNFDKRLKTTDVDVSGMQITVMDHDEFIKELKQERLYRPMPGW